MISLGRLTSPTVRRETRSYTSDRLDAAFYAASTGQALATAVGAVETSIGMLSRAMSLATVTPSNNLTRSITAPFLELVVRELLTMGSIVCDLEVDQRGLVLRPASAASVMRGDSDPASWVYVLTMTGPSSSSTRYRRRDEIAALVYGRNARQPWAGCPPWRSAQVSSDLIAGLEKQLAGESSSSSGYVLAVPDTGDHGQAADADGEDDPLTALRRDLAAARGRTLLAPSMSGGFGAGPGVSPHDEYQAKRFGIDPPEAVIELRRDVERTMLAAFGVPPAILDPKVAGTAMREGLRFFQSQTVTPLATLIAVQLSEALGEDITLTLPRPTDVATLSRAIHSLTQSGMSISDARAVVGL